MTGRTGSGSKARRFTHSTQGPGELSILLVSWRPAKAASRLSGCSAGPTASLVE